MRRTPLPRRDEKRKALKAGEAGDGEGDDSEGEDVIRIEAEKAALDRAKERISLKHKNSRCSGRRGPGRLVRQEGEGIEGTGIRGERGGGTHGGAKRGKQTDRETDGQTHRRTDRQTHRQTHRETGRGTGRGTDR